MKDVDSAMLKIRQQEMKLECIRMAINISSIGSLGSTVQTTKKIIAEAKDILDWVKQ